MGEYIKSYENFIKEAKENDVNTNSDDKELDLSDEILNDYSFKKIDYYYLKNKLDKMLVKEMYDMIEDNEYRAFATFSDNIEYFEEIPCNLIALVNYPPLRFNKRTIKDAIESIKKYEYVDEIEFPWDLSYNNFGVDFWRDIILDVSNNGFILRPMVEFGIWSDTQIKQTIEFFKKINIMNIMTSTGLNSNITTIDKWNDIKKLIPNKWVVKVGGILNINDINNFIKSDVDLAATTISLKATYGEELGLN
jgi:hypothetical protein